MSLNEMMECASWFAEAQKNYLFCRTVARSADDEERESCYCVLSFYNATLHVPTGDGAFYKCDREIQLEADDTANCSAFERDWAMPGAQAAASGGGAWSWLPSWHIGPPSPETVSRFGPLLALVCLVLVTACLVYLFTDWIVAVLWRCTEAMTGATSSQGENVLGLATWCDDACRREVAAHRERKRRRKERRMARRRNRDGESQPLKPGQEDPSSGGELDDSSEDSSDSEPDRNFRTQQAADQLSLRSQGSASRSSRQDPRGEFDTLRDAERQWQTGSDSQTMRSGDQESRGGSITLQDADPQRPLGNGSLTLRSSGEVTFDSPKALKTTGSQTEARGGAYNLGAGHPGSNADVRMHSLAGAAQPSSAQVLQGESAWTRVPFPAGQGTGGMFASGASSGRVSSQRRTFQA